MLHGHQHRAAPFAADAKSLAIRSTTSATAAHGPICS
jgi:hypothetical protein